MRTKQNDNYKLLVKTKYLRDIPFLNKYHFKIYSSLTLYLSIHKEFIYGTRLFFRNDAVNINNESIVN